jgi:hypothetical protein
MQTREKSVQAKALLGKLPKKKKKSKSKSCISFSVKTVVSLLLFHSGPSLKKKKSTKFLCWMNLF